MVANDSKLDIGGWTCGEGRPGRAGLAGAAHGAGLEDDRGRRECVTRVRSCSPPRPPPSRRRRRRREGRVGDRGALARNAWRSRSATASSRRSRTRPHASSAIRLFVDGRYSAHSTTDLRPDRVAGVRGERAWRSRALQPDPHRRLADPARYPAAAAGARARGRAAWASWIATRAWPGCARWTSA